MLSASSSSSFSQSAMCSSMCEARSAQEAGLHQALDGLLDVGDGVLHAALEHRGRGKFAALRGYPRRALRRLLGALALERRGRHHLAAERCAESLEVDDVAVFAHDVYHVHGHHRGDAQLDELGGQIQVSLYICAVYYIDDGVRLLADEIVPRDDLLKRVGRQRIYAGQVLDYDVGTALETAFLFFDRDAGPVAHALVGARQVVEHRRLAAVRVAGKRNFHTHAFSPLSCG